MALERIASNRLDRLTDQLADRVMAAGIGTFGLRGVAGDLGTSDRMLIYYFGSKTALIEAVLLRIYERLTVALEAVENGGPQQPDQLLASLWARLRTAQLGPFMRVWAEVNARGMRGEEPFRSFAARTIETWRQWIQDRLAPLESGSAQACAAALLAIVDGAIMQSVTQLETADEAVGFVVESWWRR